MAFEVRRGRSCDSLQVLNDRIIKSQGEQLLNFDKALKLSEDKSKTLSSLLGNARESNQIEMKQYLLDKQRLKSKIRKRNILVIGQTVLIVILLI